MSKAFTSEQELPDAPQRPLPVGRRPITPPGMARLQNTLRGLVNQVHAALGAATLDDSDARARERALNRQAATVAALIALCDVAPAVPTVPSRAVLGTRVTVRDEAGSYAHYTLVGPDEIDVARGCISHASPIGRALVGLGVGAWASIVRPRGVWEVEVTAITAPP